MFLTLNADKLDVWKFGYRKKTVASVYLNKVKKLRERVRLHKRRAMDFSLASDLLVLTPLSQHTLSVPLLVV